MNDDPEAAGPEPANLRFLRRLVTVLTATMILGICGIFGLLFLRLSNQPPPLTPLPDTLVLPGDARPIAYTQGSDWFAVVTEDDRILIFDRASGALRQTVVIAR